MTNVAGKAYGMNVVTPMRPTCTWLNRFIFMISRAFPGTLSGLLGLSLIHFARWVIIRRDQWPQCGQPPQKLQNDYMLFCSNFNGTWDQYIDAFADGIPSGLDLFWYSSTKYPNSIPITPFKTYIHNNQVDTGYYYNATPGSGQRDIKQALKLAAALRAVKDSGDDAALAAAYEEVLLVAQGCLGSPGYAPIASCDTAIADLHRCQAVRERWGPHGDGPPEATPMSFAPEVAHLRGKRTPDDADIEAVKAAVDAVVESDSMVEESAPEKSAGGSPPVPAVDLQKEKADA